MVGEWQRKFFQHFLSIYGFCHILPKFSGIIHVVFIVIKKYIMKAVRIHEFGGPEVLKLEETPRPKPAADEVLIKVYATSVNPVDWKIRKGARKERFPSDLPLTLGWDVSGVIEETGNAVKNFKKGDEVYGRPDPTRNELMQNMLS